MTDVTMTALDTMHISNVRAENLAAGDVFTVNEADAKRLEEAGLAERGGKTADAVNVGFASDLAKTREQIDAERGQADGLHTIGLAPANKAAPAPSNKTAASKQKA